MSAAIFDLSVGYASPRFQVIIYRFDYYILISAVVDPVEKSPR